MKLLLSAEWKYNNMDFKYFTTKMKTLSSLLLLLAFGNVQAQDVQVSPGQSIQAAIDNASDGDTLLLSDGTYLGNINFSGKAITIRGNGRNSIIQGDGNGSVVRFDSGETADSVLDSVRIIGGLANAGGGIYVVDSSPTIIRNAIERNRAMSSGSGICVRGENANPLISNNVIFRNTRSGSGDPHAIQIINGSPVVINNTIVRNDSNGVHLSGATESVVMNNIIAFNGTTRGFRRGRGICDFSSRDVTIAYNLIRDNEISALLRNGRDYNRIRRVSGAANIFNNIDGDPRFRRARRGTIRRRSRAVNRGNPDSQFADTDGSRNDIGATGGPDAR